MLSRERGRVAQERYAEHLQRRMGQGMSEAAAHAAAADDLIGETLTKARRTAHAKTLQLETFRRHQDRYGTTRDKDLILKDLERTEMEVLALEKAFMGSIRDFLQNFRTNLAGQVRGRALLSDVVKELHSEASGNAAAEAIAKAVLKAYERARALANANGMDIPRLADWGIRHTHDAKKIAAAGYRAWSDHVYERADWSRIVNHRTNKPFAVAKGARPFRDDVEPMLQEIYQGVIKKGWDDRAPSMTTGARALYNTRTDHRVLHFKSAADWMAYNDAFGAENPFQGIVSHFRGMARDIALMRNWGPNPRAGLEGAIQIMTKRADDLDGAGALKWIDNVGRKGRKARVMMALLNGSASQPHHEFWARMFAGTRNLLTASQLGSAILSSVTDLASVRMAATALKLSQNNHLKHVFGGLLGGMDAKTARDLGFIFDTWFDSGAGSARFMGDVWSPELTSRITDGVLRASGLNYWTDRFRVGVEAAFGSDLADLAAKSFDDLHDELKVFMGSRGVGAREWDAVRAAEAIYTDAQGGRHINANWFLEHTSLPRADAEDIAIRWGALVQDHVRQAVPTTSLRGRATIIGDSKAGTFLGELARSNFMYKNYVFQQMFNMVRRLQEMPGNLGTKALFVGNYIASMTVMGAFALQLKEIAKGNDPMAMIDSDDWMATTTFWAAAMAQGGGLGIAGDFFRASTSRTGGGILEVAAGPVVGLVSDISRATTGQLGNAWEGGQTSFARSMVNLGRRYNPLASYAPLRAALDRMLWDQIQRLVDPEADKQFQQVARRLKKEKGTEMYWPRGQMLPERLPSFGGGA